MSTPTCSIPSVGQLYQRKQEPIYFVASCSSCGTKDLSKGNICVIGIGLSQAFGSLKYRV